MSTTPRLQPAPPRQQYVRAVLEEAPAVLGLGLICAGVYQLAGVAWTLIAAGAPLLLTYVLRETRFVWRRRKP